MFKILQVYAACAKYCRGKKSKWEKLKSICQTGGLSCLPSFLVLHGTYFYSSSFRWSSSNSSENTSLTHSNLFFPWRILHCYTRTVLLTFKVDFVKSRFGIYAPVAVYQKKSWDPVSAYHLVCSLVLFIFQLWCLV